MAAYGRPGSQIALRRRRLQDTLAMTIVDGTVIPENEADRLATIRLYDILDTPPDGAFDRITALAARIFEVPIAIVSVVDHDRIWFKSHHGLDVGEVDRAPGLCASAILQDDVWVINDAPMDPRALTNPLVAGEFGLKFYAGAPLRTPDGYNLGTLCVLDFAPREMTPAETKTLEDLSATVIAELELRRATRSLLEAATERERLKDAFVGMLSHELRTPMTTILAAGHLLAASPAVASDPRVRDLSRDVVSESERLVRLVEDLLVLTNVEQGSLDTHSEPVLLQHVLPKIVNRESRRSPDRVIRLDAQHGLPPVAGDELHLEQVLSNLLSNAIKYSEPESAIDIAARAVNDHVEVRVRDRGIGLSIDDRDRVFELFVRTPEAKRRAAGAGIGLYVCRILVEAMGGTIWAEDSQDPAGGAVFAVRLRVATD